MQVLKAPQAQVLSALQSVAGVVERRQTLPILSNVLLRKSGTEPVLRVMAEAPEDAICRECVTQIVDVIRQKGHCIS